MGRVKVYKFFVRNLPWTVNTKEVKKYFSKFGQVSEAVVVFDHNTGFSKSYGFVYVIGDEMRTKVINETHTLEGKQLAVIESER
ncbi:SRA stem-loop-interacting RNA-binding protein, mitochondrial [Orussus abietinus]|uniref:SRA stem-loop-interacting RNA-binding protein, mitochondrial n=1 Tax=Orussus abietinus TaxID=222816 RepID=UPI00062627B6|nr:SRA stem-loop-interacting RNA-binding protein, mitochondrial [Orussus abietinus]